MIILLLQFVKIFLYNFLELLDETSKTSCSSLANKSNLLEFNVDKNNAVHHNITGKSYNLSQLSK